MSPDTSPTSEEFKEPEWLFWGYAFAAVVAVSMICFALWNVLSGTSWTSQALSLTFGPSVLCMSVAQIAPERRKILRYTLTFLGLVLAVVGLIAVVMVRI
jgi:hypothetical protein